jgi:hypothetical protein
VVLKASIGFKVKAVARFKPEVPAKPMPCVVNTFEYFEDLNLVPNAEIEPEGRFLNHF